MSDYSMAELEYWNNRIEAAAGEAGLSFYEQEFEIVSYEDMLSYETYTGMPSHYPHWSYGKYYEKLKTYNIYNLAGLPYEMVINSDPCIAYLMKDNTLLLQILTMAHVYGHNDFFRNNRLFKQGTNAKQTVEKFKNHAGRIREYIADPGIGYLKVEKVLNAAHALKLQVSRTPGEKRIPEDVKRKQLLEDMNTGRSDYYLLEPEGMRKKTYADIKKVPLDREDDIMLFIAAYGRLEDWEKDILNIVREEALYFIPQIETKIMNEGWASFWHYQLLKKLELPQGLHMEFLKRHNQVVRPHEGKINPYFLGFRIFEDISSKCGDSLQKLFEIREIERDESFIRRYLTFELCKEMNLFEYGKNGNEYLITEVADEEGWEKIRDNLASSCGMGSIPGIYVEEWVRKDNTLILNHSYDDRELELNYAYETLKHLVDLWDGRVMLETFIDDKKKIIICDDQKKISVLNG